MVNLVGVGWVGKNFQRQKLPGYLFSTPTSQTLLTKNDLLPRPISFFTQTLLTINSLRKGNPKMNAEELPKLDDEACVYLSVINDVMTANMNRALVAIRDGNAPVPFGMTRDEAVAAERARGLELRRQTLVKIARELASVKFPAGPRSGRRNKGGSSRA
jgi:hypothetical protein